MLVSYGYGAGGLVMTGGGVAAEVIAGGGALFVLPAAAVFDGAAVVDPPIAIGAPPAPFTPELCGVPPLPIAATEPPLPVAADGDGSECDEELLPLQPRTIETQKYTTPPLRIPRPPVPTRDWPSLVIVLIESDDVHRIGGAGCSRG
jgi:hypothetical protein